MATVEESWLGYKARSFELLGLVQGDQVLDVGCGTGGDVRALAGRFPGVSVLGIDASEDKIREARALSLGLPRPVDFQVGDAYALAFEDGTFDVVISNGVIDLIPDKDAVLAELHRVLVPGGRLQIADVTIQNPVSEEGRRKIDLWTG